MEPVLFNRIAVRLDEPQLKDVGGHTDAALAGCGVSLAPGSRVAIAVGSRGIADQLTVVGCVVEWVRRQGAEPFIVPAMGSHGGATAEGQREVLESYGVGSLGVPIVASMDVVSVPQDSCPVPVYSDAAAAAADATIIVNRVKAHTDFRGTYESGIMKMTAIGLGKQVQANAIHAYGQRGLRDFMPLVARQVLKHGNVVLGVAIVENALDRTMMVEAIPAGMVPEVEPGLLELARTHSPRLPMDTLDVLLVDRMGKDVSGVGMDVNVIGRMLITGCEDPPRPRINLVVCHSLTPASHGNATGMGLADIIPQSMADTIDHDVTRTNVITSGALLRGKLPMVAPDDRTAWEWSLRGASVVDPSMVRAARIVDTLHCAELWVTDAVLADLAAEVSAGRIEVQEFGVALHDEQGRLRPFDGS